MFFPELEPRRETAQIKFGQSVSLGSFWVSSVVEGNPYLLLPINASASLAFLYNPEQPPKKKKLQERELLQSMVFEDSAFDDPKGIELPPQLYKSLSSMDKAESIDSELSEYLPMAKKYFETVEQIGPESEISNSPFFLQIGSNVGSVHLEGEQSSKIIYLTGRFDEVRKGGDKDTVIRIRQNRGKPTEYDAIRLTLDAIAYMAATKERGARPKFPKLSVFNLTDGKYYLMKAVPFSPLARNVINAINFSDLSLRAGYLRIDEKKPATIDPNFIRDHEKKVYIKTRAGRQMLTAEEAFKRAENSLKRMRGELPYSERLYHFAEVK